MTSLSVAFSRLDITPWTKFIFEELKVSLSGSSPPFSETRTFSWPYLKDSPSVLMEKDMFLSQFKLLNSLKTHLNIIHSFMLKSSAWFGVYTFST